MKNRRSVGAERYAPKVMKAITGGGNGRTIPVTRARMSRSWNVYESVPKLYYKKYTPGVKSNILSKLIFASCVRYSDRAYHGLCVLIKDIGRRLPLQLQCSYQGQQGEVSQSVRGNYKLLALRILNRNFGCGGRKIEKIITWVM